MTYGSVLDYYRPSTSAETSFPTSNANQNDSSNRSPSDENAYATSSLLRSETTNSSSLLLLGGTQPMDSDANVAQESTILANSTPQPNFTESTASFNCDASSSSNAESLPSTFESESRDAYMRSDNQLFPQLANQGFLQMGSRQFYSYPNSFQQHQQQYRTFGNSEQVAFTPYLNAVVNGSFYGQSQQQQNPENYTAVSSGYMGPLQSTPVQSVPPNNTATNPSTPATAATADQSMDSPAQPCSRWQTSDPKMPITRLMKEACSPTSKKIRFSTYNQLDQKAVSIMEEWYSRHQDRPYPSRKEKQLMANSGGITETQVRGGTLEYCDFI